MAGGALYSAQALLDELYASLADRSTTKLLTALARMQPLCIDELGYLNLKTEQTNAFFRLMDQRYGRVSTIITTNLDYPSGTSCLTTSRWSMPCLIGCSTIRIEGASLRTSAPATAPVQSSTSPASPKAK